MRTNNFVTFEPEERACLFFTIFFFFFFYETKVAEIIGAASAAPAAPTPTALWKPTYTFIQIHPRKLAHLHNHEYSM